MTTASTYEPALAGPNQNHGQPVTPGVTDEYKDDDQEMTPVLRMADQRDELTSSALSVTPALCDPLLQLEFEAQPPSGPAAVRCVGHPRELSLRGIPLSCSVCRGRRDWLLINQGRRVWARCRCGNQWLEPEITRADFDALLTDPRWTTYPSVEQAVTAYGFDGVLAGIYLG